MKFICALCVVMAMSSLAVAAEDPFMGLRDLLQAGCHEETRDQLLTALQTFREQGNASGEAAAWLLLGANDSAMGDVNAARFELEEAEAMFKASDDVFGACLSNMGLAELERGLGRIQSALAVQRRGRELLERAGDPRSRFSLASMRTLAPVFGVPSEQLALLSAIPELMKPLLLRFIGVLVRGTYAGTLLEAGELDRAERELAKANEDATLFGEVFDADLALYVGDLRQRQWRLEEAKESYLKALNGASAMMIPVGGAQRKLSILGRLAELDVFTGRVEEALAWNDRALTFVQDVRQPNLRAGVLHGRADLLQKAGRYEEAIALYEQLLKLATANADLALEASVECDLGAVHMFQGTYGTSARHLERAVELQQKLHEPYVEAPTWLLLAEVDLQLNLQSGAADALEKARVLAKTSGFGLAERNVELLSATSKFMRGQGTLSNVQDAIQALQALPDAQDPIWSDVIASFAPILQFASGAPVPFEFRGHAQSSMQCMPLMLKGKLLLDRGDSQGARAAWTQALEMHPNNDFRAGLFGLIAASYWNEGKHNEGIRNFANAARALEVGAEDVKVEDMLAGYLGADRRRYYDFLIDTLIVDGRWRDAFAQTERARARAFLQMVGNHRFNAERSADTRLVREGEILRNEIAVRERQPGKAADVARLRERYQTLLTRMKASNPEYASLTLIEPLRLEEVQDQLEPGTTLISYFVSLNVVHVWVVDHADAHHAVLPIDQNRLGRIVCWARAMGAPTSRGASLIGECDDTATADDAFDQLIAPIRGWIQQPKLIVIPHGVLHYVPFAALHDRANNRYLVDDFTLTYAPSASALRFLRAKESPVDGGTLVLGDPATSLPRLPGAAQEATSVARILGTTAHLGADAREELLFDLHGKTDLVHLAAHGLYDPASPLFSRIVLAAGGRRDGNLTVQDILSSVDLTGVNLVVLSACQSAVGARSGGDEVVGLTRALLYAGTPGVISTLWDIDDAASAGLMEEFYRRLVAGVPAAEALRQAQLTVKQRYPDPRYWAAFTLSGDPQGRWKRLER